MIKEHWLISLKQKMVRNADMWNIYLSFCKHFYERSGFFLKEKGKQGIKYIKILEYYPSSVGQKS